MCPASKVLRWMLGAIVWRLFRGKYIILCESHGQRALNGSILLRDGIPNDGHYFTERTGMEQNSSVTLFYGTEQVRMHIRLPKMSHVH